MFTLNLFNEAILRLGIMISKNDKQLKVKCYFLQFKIFVTLTIPT